MAVASRHGAMALALLASTVAAVAAQSHNVSTRIDSYLRIGYRDADTSMFWGQLVAGNAGDTFDGNDAADRHLVPIGHGLPGDFQLGRDLH